MNSKRTLTRALAILALMGGLTACQGVTDKAAFEDLQAALGSTDFTVYPAFVRSSGKPEYDADAAQRIAGFLTREGLGEAHAADEHVPIPGPWGRNQAKMFRASSEAFVAYLEQHPSQTEYALLPEYLIGGRGTAVGIHLYTVDRSGRVAFALLLNSHHEAFSKADPKGPDECTGVLIDLLDEHWQPEPGT